MLSRISSEFSLDFYLRAYNFVLKSFGHEIIVFLSRNSGGDSEFKRGRQGYYDTAAIPSGTPRVWFHAVSVGEVTGAVPTLRALKRALPEAGVFLTTGTPQGARHARNLLAAEAPVFAFPLDLADYVSRALDFFQPNLFVNFETEFWPNYYQELEKRRIPALLLNGRVSGSSARFYRTLYPLFGRVFERFDRMAMHSREDMETAMRMGAPREKMLVLGSSKYDGLADKAAPAREEHWRRVLRLDGSAPVVVGGSLRGLERIGVLRVFRDLRQSAPGLRGIFAPRHMDGIPEMRQWLDGERIDYNLLTELENGSGYRTAPVTLVDRIGALFDLYAVGDLIFCGGTLAPVGGHNILEPAAWSKAVFYGPHLKKILREHRILRDFGGSFPVRDLDDLLAQWKRWIADIDGLKKHGVMARRALDSQKGVVDAQVGLVLEALSSGPGTPPRG